MIQAFRQFREQGYVKTRRFVFHPHSYGIATLMRIGVRLPGGGQLVLHHFRPHDETEFHDHPWAFRTLVLWGGYVDESLDLETGDTRRDVLGPGHYRRRPARHIHRTQSTAKHTWTLVLVAPKEREWRHGVRLDFLLDFPMKEEAEVETVIPASFWRTLPCGHPPDPVAVRINGEFVCHCGQALDPDRHGMIVDGAPGRVVQCATCGCHPACPDNAPDAVAR